MTLVSLELSTTPAARDAVLELARYYIYDLAEYMDGPGGWRLPETGAYPIPDAFLSYWTHVGDPVPGRFAFLIRSEGELAGFALIRTADLDPGVDVHLAEFFVINRRRRRGIGKKALELLADRMPGRWEVMQLLNNTASILFWEQAIRDYTGGKLSIEQRMIQSPIPHMKIVMTFDTKDHPKPC